MMCPGSYFPFLPQAHCASFQATFAINQSRGTRIFTTGKIVPSINHIAILEFLNRLDKGEDFSVFHVRNDGVV